MNKVIFLLQDDKTGMYLSKNLKSLTDKEQEADQYKSTEDAISALVNSRIKADVSVIKTSVTVIKQETKFLEIEELILLRNSHLDATHVGLRGNPYFYLCNEETGIDYCYNFQEAVWEICDWSYQSGDSSFKPKSQAKEFIRINLE